MEGEIEEAVLSYSLLENTGTNIRNYFSHIVSIKNSFEDGI